MVYLIVIPILISSVAYAANDWSKPCLSGVCQYDLPSASNGGSSGTIKIWGSQDAISDITTAASWEIIGCSPNATTQNIRLVCKEEETSSKTCGHLFSKSGPVGKIVRLPESCGKGAFARVAKSWTPTDQSIPSSISRRLVRRNGVQPQVKALTLDSNFAAANNTQYGSVNFILRAATVPGANGDIEIPSNVQSRTHHHRRGFPSLRSIGSSIGSLLGGITSTNDWSKSTSASLPLDATKSLQIFNQNISCPPLSTGAKINVNVDAHGTANIGVVASGKLLPPAIDDFAITTSLTVSLGGSINLNANIGGSLDSGKIPIFSVGIPGLDIPGILTIGPSFVVNAEVIASLEVDADLTVGVNYNINNAAFVYPPQSGSPTSGSFDIGDTPLQLSLDSSVEATASVEAHIIPTLNLGINVLDGFVNSGIFLDLDTSAKAALTVNATEQATAPTVLKPATITQSLQQRDVQSIRPARRHINSENNDWNGPGYTNNRPGSHASRPGYYSYSGHNGRPSYNKHPAYSSHAGNHNDQSSNGGNKPPAHQPAPQSHRITSSVHPSNTSVASSITSATFNSTSLSSVTPTTVWTSGGQTLNTTRPLTSSQLPASSSSGRSGTGSTVTSDERPFPTTIPPVKSTSSVTLDAPTRTSSTVSRSAPPYGYPPASPPRTSTTDSTLYYSTSSRGSSKSAPIYDTSSAPTSRVSSIGGTSTTGRYHSPPSASTSSVATSLRTSTRISSSLSSITISSNASSTISYSTIQSASPSTSGHISSSSPNALSSTIISRSTSSTISFSAMKPANSSTSARISSSSPSSTIVRTSASSTIKAPSSIASSASPSTSHPVSSATIQPNTTTTTTPIPSASPVRIRESLTACFDVTAGLAINVGATADFAKLFDPSITLTVFSKQYNLFEKCISNGNSGSNSRRSIRGPRIANRTVEGALLDMSKRDLSCPSKSKGSSATGDLTSLVDDTIKASSIIPE